MSIDRLVQTIFAQKWFLPETLFSKTNKFCCGRNTIGQSSITRWSALATVWPDMVKFCQFSKNLEVLGNIWKVCLIFGRVLTPLWDFLYAFGQNFIVVNGQILKKQSDHLVTLPRCCCHLWTFFWPRRWINNTSFVWVSKVIWWFQHGAFLVEVDEGLIG